MKVLLQTNFFNPIEVYDTNAPQVASTGPSFRQKMIEFLKPVIQVTSDDGRTVIYKSGDFYSPTGQWWIAGAAAALLVGIALIAGAKSSKKK